MLLRLPFQDFQDSFLEFLLLFDFCNHYDMFKYFLCKFYSLDMFEKKFIFKSIHSSKYFYVGNLHTFYLLSASGLGLVGINSSFKKLIDSLLDYSHIPLIILGVFLEKNLRNFHQKLPESSKK